MSITRLGFIRGVTVGVGLLSVMLGFQNCGRSALDGLESTSVLGALDYSEDNLFLNLQNGQATVSELNYSVSRYRDFLDTQVASMNSTGVESGQSGTMPLGTVIRQLSSRIDAVVSELRSLLFNQKLSTNSPEVLKKYTELVDLLARARDMNNYLILTANIGDVRKSVDENRRDLVELRKDFGALQASLNEVRTVIIPGLKKDLEAQLGRVSQSLQDEIGNRQAAVASLETSIKNETDTREREILNLKLETEKGLLNLRTELSSKIQKTQDDLQKEVEAVRIVANSNLTLIRGLQESILVLNHRAKETAEELKQLSENVTHDIDTIQSELEKIRTHGNESYEEMVANWKCSSDMIDRNGFNFYGQTAFQKLGLDVSEACVNQKEDVLFAICTERYPTFCGQCQGYTKAQDCPVWEAMSGKDRLEILMNIRQEVAIHHLNEQSKLHGQAIYGGDSCKVHCLTGANDPEVRNLLGSLISPSSGSNSSASCGQDEWKSCGLYGVTYSLAVNDVNLAQKINDVNTNLSSELGKLRVDFESEKKAVASRFGILEAELNQKIDQLKRATEARFTQIAKTMAGLSTGSGPEVAGDLAARSTYLGELATNAATKKDLALDAIAKAMGTSQDVAKANLLERDDEIVKLLSSGLAVSSFDVLTEVFRTLNPNQNSRPFYDTEFQNQVGSSCQDHMKFTPFTNILGRDTHEILALSYMRLLLTGQRSNQTEANKIFFNHPGVISSNSLQQIVLARMFDYRSNPEVTVSSNCLNAIDQFARNMILNDTSFASLRLLLSQNITFQRMATLLVDDAKKLFDKVGALHTLILGSKSVDLKTLDADLALIVNRLVDASIAQRRFDLVSIEVENMIAIQKELSKDNGFQNEFNAYLLQYKDSMAAMKTGLEADRTKLAAEISERQRQTGALAAQLGQVKDAMGYVAALAMTDPLASADLKRKVQAAATVDGNIENLITQINNSGRNQVEQPFTPAIRAIRHVTQGNVTCFGAQTNVGSLPSGSAFVGGWGVTLNGQAPWFPGDSCAFNFRNGTNLKDTVVYRLWASAHKVEFTSGNGSFRSTIDFRQAAQASPNLRRIVSGEFKQGLFDAQVPSLLNPVLALSSVSISMTPIYTSVAGADTRGTTQNYSMQLYSPLVLDFLNKGLPQTIEPSQSPVEFDLSSTGMKQRVGWVNGRQGGLLALDLNGNNRIDDGSELFGEFTKLYKTGLRASNGYEALKQYDMNQDGVIDHQDPIYEKILVWFDHNANGISEPSELVSLKQAQVSKISLRYQELPLEKQNSNGNQIKYQAKFYGPASCGVGGCSSYDIYFGTSWKDETPKILSQK
jgi:hypothetical protein